MSRFSKNDYEFAATMVREIREKMAARKTHETLLRHSTRSMYYELCARDISAYFIRTFAADNPRFDPERWMRETGHNPDSRL